MATLSCLAWVYPPTQGSVATMALCLGLLLPPLGIGILFYCWFRKNAGMLFGSVFLATCLLHTGVHFLYRYSPDWLYQSASSALLTLLVLQVAVYTLLVGYARYCLRTKV